MMRVKEMEVAKMELVIPKKNVVPREEKRLEVVPVDLEYAAYVMMITIYLFYQCWIKLHSF